MSDYSNLVDQYMSEIFKCMRISDPRDRAAAVRAELAEMAEGVASMARRVHERESVHYFNGLDQYSDEDVRRLSRARF